MPGIEKQGIETMIDWSRVAELRDEVGAEDFGEVVELFLGEVEEELSVLPSSHDAAELEVRLHFLKGSALNLGFCDFSELCQAGETTAREEGAGKVDAAAIAACFHASKSEFLTTLRQIAAA